MSDLAAQISGQTLAVDGGVSVKNPLVPDTAALLSWAAGISEASGKGATASPASPVAKEPKDR